MDSITDLPYRTIVKKIFDQYNTKDELRLWTEFMNTDGYMTSPSRMIKHLIHHDQEIPLYAQIYGGNIDTLIKTAQDIEHKYPTFAGIELNIWFPSPKVSACGGGSRMMKDKTKCLDMIRQISESISMPFSIKVRAWLDDADKEAQSAMLIQAARYCHTMSIHGRTISQWHSGEVDREFIYTIKQAVWSTCKIIGNGGIHSYQDAKQKVVLLSPSWQGGGTTDSSGVGGLGGKDFPSLDGIMIAQSAIGNPRVFVDHEPTLHERYDIIIEHLKLSIAYELYVKETLEKYPENDKDPILQQNRQALHYKKKIEDDDSIISSTLKTQMHDYVFPFPSYALLEKTMQTIQTDDITPYRSCLEFRKYLFNYIKGIPGSKECKQQIAMTTNYNELYNLITQFFDMSTKE